MSLRIGRFVGQEAKDCDPLPERHIKSEQALHGRIVAGRFDIEAWALRGFETGAGAEALTDDLVLAEAKRPGSRYVKSDDGRLPEGYYELDGRPTRRQHAAPSPTFEWAVRLLRQEDPDVWRYAVDDNVAGSDIADIESQTPNGAFVRYTPTTTETTVLGPRTLGGQPFNLPMGSWNIWARVFSTTNVSQKYRARIVDLSGNALATGNQVTVGTGNNDKWVEVALGPLTILKANHKANWPELRVQGVTGELGNVQIDWWRFASA